MLKQKKFNLEGKELGEVHISQTLAKAEANGQSIKDYIVAIRNNLRQWSANTKGRSEVVHTTAKPHPQKGTGRARQGSLVSPQFRGGGIVFGPKPKFDQHVRINKKERRAALRFLIGEKIRNGNFHVIDSMEMKTPKTKDVAHFLKKLDIPGRVLFVGESEHVEVDTEGTKVKANVKCDKHAHFAKSVNNIPKTRFALATTISGYDVMVAKQMVVTESALHEIENWLCGPKE